MSYVLGRRPDEFGLLPDDNGFVKIKNLLKAVSEEVGWRYVRRSHLDEMMITLRKPPLEIVDPLIRAVDRSLLPEYRIRTTPPKLLYTCVRQKAYPHILEKGIYPSRENRIVMASSPDMAARIGRRKDPFPVTITVNTASGIHSGMTIYGAGGDIYWAPFLPVGSFYGPPLPKEKPLAQKPPASPGAGRLEQPGSFHLKPVSETGGWKKSEKPHRRKEVAWKKGRRQMNKTR